VKIILAALDEELVEAWVKHCGNLKCVQVHAGSIFDVSCDAVVSPANSFGFMDGGIDLLYSQHFGWHVQDRLQKLIHEHHHGELLVGSAEIVETRDDDIPFLIAAPTMRVPTILRRSVAPYLAARAAILLVRHGEFKSGPHKNSRISEKVTCLALPGLGTGVGQVSPDLCGRQVRAAIEDATGSPRIHTTWQEAQERHQLLFTDRVGDLQSEDPFGSRDKILKQMRGRFLGHYRRGKTRR
jgi:O-acetyl-ADP-ribose deacetylase (regulator of RNase III)